MSDSSAAIDLVVEATEIQAQHRARSSRKDSKEKGQFFTPPAVARFMAARLNLSGSNLRILDPGAGSGILSVAVCERLLRLKARRSVHFELFETDPTVIPALTACMESSKRALSKAGHRVTYEIAPQDFLLSASTQSSLFSEGSERPLVDGVIMNPPYFKIGRGTDYSRVLPHRLQGQPNVYALFMAIGAQRLKANGVLVAITPRSFCNGLYFKGFRRWFFEHMSLEHVHHFESRRDTFSDSAVLQESIITTSARRGQRNSIKVSTSFGQTLSASPKGIDLPAETIIDDTAGDHVIRVPEAPADLEVMRCVESWPRRFADAGLRISTGPVVAFRARPWLISEDSREPSSIPLLSIHNVRAFETQWPVQKGSKPTALRLNKDSSALVLEAKNYVLVRRFTAKEERRRLVASVYLGEPRAQGFVALENHLNYIYHASRELTRAECLGIAALFNSRLYDRYFRTISGSTQVNATEVRTLPIPELTDLARLGEKLLRCQGMAARAREGAVMDQLGVPKRLQKELVKEA